MAVILTKSLSKNFGATKALDSISITVNEGEIYGFLGLNGAGKTTLIRALLGMIKPGSGSVSLFGKEVGAGFDLWNEVGYLVETPYSYPNLTVAENLEVIYKLRGLTHRGLINDIISQLKLEKYRNKQARVLSLGNQQRLGLAKALMHRPRLLILDEPINGLDPEGIVEVRELLKDLANQGSTVFLSSHILDEISKLAGRTGIIHNGKLVKELTPDELSAQLKTKLLVNTADNVKALEHLALAGYTGILNTENEIELHTGDATLFPEKIAVVLVQAGLPVKKLLVHTEDLEMYFLRTIKNG